MFGHISFDASFLLHLDEGLSILFIVEIFVLRIILDHLVNLSINCPILLDIVLPEESDQVFPLVFLDLLLQSLHHHVEQSVPISNISLSCYGFFEG